MEIQRVIEVSTGVKLPLVDKATSPMIVVGACEAAQAAGIDAEKLPEEAFRLLAKDGIFFIVGKDTPDANDGRGFSRGTYYGACEFLERVVGVRWLLPGPEGEDISCYKEITVSDLDVTSVPAFSMRLLEYVRETQGPRKGVPSVDEWLRRQKVGCSFPVLTGHSWSDLERDRPEIFKPHPEWKAVDGDQGKYCTANEACIKAMADYFAWCVNTKGHRSYSVSPADGGGFCKCEKCRTLIETDPHGYPSYTRVILKYYNDLGKILGEKAPGKYFAGLVYYNYMYPPKEAVKMAPNIRLHFAGLEYYGFGLYKPKYRDEFERVLKRWGQIAPHLTMTSYTFWWRSESGAPYPPPMELLKLELPVSKKCGVQGVNVVGEQAWGYGAPLNYLLAKQMWNPSLDLEKIFDEWLERAYGPGWKFMRHFFDLLDRDFKKLKIKEAERDTTQLKYRNYDITYAVISDIHLPRFAEMEHLFTEAMNRVATDAQRKRLQMFGDNLVQFHYQARKAGLLKDPEMSVFYRSDEDYKKSSAEASKGIALRQLKAGGYVDRPIWVPEKRQIHVPRLKAGGTPPRMDGDLSDTAWEKAAVADQFRKAGFRETSGDATMVKAIYDGKNLYLSFFCVDRKPGELEKEGAARDDSRIYNGDVVEMFLMPRTGGADYWHLTVNPAGLQWDAFKTREDNLAWDCAAKVADKGWTVEVRIPFAALQEGVPSGKTWKVNLTRSCRSAKENSSWNSVEEHFGRIEEFGEWVFE